MSVQVRIEERRPKKGSPEQRVATSLEVDAALLFTSVMWASTFTLFKVAWEEIDPVAFTALRFAAMVVVAVAVVLLARDRVRPGRSDLPALAASGFTGYFLYQMAFVLGLDRTSAIASSILVATHPIFSVVFLALLGRERPGKAQWTGVGVGFLGVAVFLGAGEAFEAATWGDLLSLGAAAAFGAYGVINQPLTRRYPGRELMAYTLGVGGVLIFLTGLPAIARQDWSVVSGPTWLIMSYAIVGPVYLAYGLWNWAIKKRGVARTAVFGFTTPVLAGVFAVLFLGERIEPHHLVGAALVLASLMVVRLVGAPSRRPDAA